VGRSPTADAAIPPDNGFDAVVEWQLPKPAPRSGRDEGVLIDLVASEARSPKRHEPTGDLEAEVASHGLR
jgi:hypothetical protein